MQVKSYVVWDLETTGFHHQDDHIVEIGAIVIRDGEQVSEHRWVVDNRDAEGKPIEIPEKITEINGMTTEIIAKEGVSPKQAFEEFIEVLKQEKSNLTHNGFKFDIPFFVTQAAKVLEWTEEYADGFRSELIDNMLDTAVVVKGRKLNMEPREGEFFKDYAERIMRIMAKGVKYNVKLCCEEMGIDMSAVTLHRAWGDCLMTHEIYRKLNETTV